LQLVKLDGYGVKNKYHSGRGKTIVDPHAEIVAKFKAQRKLKAKLKAKLKPKLKSKLKIIMNFQIHLKKLIIQQLFIGSYSTMFFLLKKTFFINFKSFFFNKNLIPIFFFSKTKSNLRLDVTYILSKLSLLNSPLKLIMNFIKIFIKKSKQLLRNLKKQLIIVNIIFFKKK